MYTTGNLLVDHAYKHVWSAPGQDKQYIIAPTRISPRRGDIWTTKLGMSNYNLPSQGDRYDVFTFGDLPPTLLGMSDLMSTWVSASVHSECKNLLIDIYNQNGVRFPLHLTWFLYTRHGGLVIAMKRQREYESFKFEQVYLRWRSAAYYRLKDVLTPNTVEVGYHRYIENTGGYLNFRNKVSLLKGRSEGHLMLFHNGRRVRDWSVRNLRPQDHLEYVWSLDVKEVLEYRYSDLLSFDSNLDNARKFIIPRPGLGLEIDYIDDVDFYLINYTKEFEYAGVYLHQNRVDSVRMLTHRDYALKASYINSAISDQGWSTGDDIRIEVVVRQSGFERDLVDEQLRIKELFKLPEVTRVGVMAGLVASPTYEIDISINRYLLDNHHLGLKLGGEREVSENTTNPHTVSIWTASVLETSSYLKLMRAPVNSITPELTMDAYGYNAVSKLTGLLPMEVSPTSKIVDLVYGQYCDSTVYEYDHKGILIDWHLHKKGIQYTVRNPDVALIEAYAGTGTESLKTIYNSHRNQQVVTLSKGTSYRFYKGRTNNAGEMIHWMDVTGDELYYKIVDSKVVWNSVPFADVTAIRNDLDFLSKDISLATNDGVLIFTVGGEETFPGEVNTYVLMQIPPGELDVFLNGYDCVEGIDYLVRWPEICIVSKRYRDFTKTHQRITIRARGFSDYKLGFDQDEDSGFVIRNQLSRNNRFNVRDDKITRISIGGKLKVLKDVGFAEDGTFVDPVSNGTPYRITHPYVSLRSLIDVETYDYRRISIKIDQAIEDFMDIHLPEPVDNSPNPVMDRYQVVSPFISKIMEDMLSGFISIDEFMGEYNNQVLETRFKGYEYLLPYDPILNNFREDLFVILPHQRASVELTVYQFRLLDRLIRLHLKGKIELSRYATIIT